MGNKKLTIDINKKKGLKGRNILYKKKLEAKEVTGVTGVTEVKEAAGAN